MKKAPPSDIIYRHSLAVRLWHWVNALSLVLLLMSGLQIFNFHPALYWGEDGYQGLPSFLSITPVPKNNPDGRSTLQIASLEWDVTGMLGVRIDGPKGPKTYAFPPLVTLPSERNLALGRDWHFFMAWVFVINGALYVIIGGMTGHFRRDFLPSRAQLAPRQIAQDIWNHLRFKHPTGDAARHYNFLQRLSYIGVVFVLLPTMVLSGLTMSNAVTAVFPQLFDLFGGRQSARTIHFIAATLLVLFFIIHIVQVFVAGFGNEMRSMITGYFKLPKDKTDA